MCAGGEWIRLLRRSAPELKELVLDITEQKSDGRHVQHLVLEKR